ncbi:MAG: GLUG motif-containing protein, partial [Thermoplasmatota archaeon]
VDVNGSNNTGGLSGGNDGTISNSESSGSVTGEWSVGGLVGWNKRSIENSHSDSEVFGDNVVGGLIGWNYYFSSSVKGSYSIGEVNGSENVSALVGWNDRGVVENCYVDGTVEGEENVGGLVGWNRGNVSYSYATGPVEGVKSTGGLVGWNNNTVEYSYASNTVNGNDNVGGIAGTNNGTISVSYSTGDVNGINSTGGLVGWNYDAEIMNSYSTGNVDGELDVGGLVGWNSNIIDKSFSVGTVVGNNNIGGLVGTNRGEVEDSFWDNQTSDQNESDGGTGKNTTMMKNVTTFTDTNTIGLNESWDFVGDPYDDTGDANIWYIDEEKQINHGYPFLTWEVDSVDIQPSDNATIEAGTAIDFEAMAYHWNGSLITDETTGFTWENTTEEGTFEITTAGIYTVRATYVWKTSDEVTVSVEPSDVSEVEIMPRGDQTVQIDESIDFDCWANDTYGNTITDDDTEFTWSNTDDEGIFEESVPGDYEVTAGYLGVISDPVSVTVRGPLFEFSNIRLDPKEPQVGEEVRLMVNVTNVGNDVGEYTVEFYINEEEVGSDTVNVEAGETKVASVNYTLNRADNHTLEAEGQSIYFNSYDDTSESSSYWWLLILILIILVIAVAVALYMNQKGKSDGRHSSKKTKKVKRVKNEPSGDEDY